MLASTLDPSVSKINEALSVTYKLLFILSKNIVPSRSYRAFPVTSLPAPLLVRFSVKQPYIYIWVLASTLAHSASEINKALSVTYKLLFILSKNIVPSRSYRYIRDRAFPVTRLPPPIYTKFDVKQRYQGAGKRPAAQEGRCPRAKGPRAAEQASRCSSFFFFFFFFFPASTI